MTNHLILLLYLYLLCVCQFVSHFALCVCVIPAEEGLQNGLMDKSTWGLPGSFEDPGLSEKLNRILSGDSDSAVRPSLPNSRSSSINNGMSAPNSSQSNRGNINSLRAGHTGPPTATGTASGTVTGTTTARSTASGRGFEYGHDFFSGHWAESKPFIGNYDSSLEGGSSTRNAGDDIFFVDEGQDVSPFGNLQPKRKSESYFIEHVVYVSLLIL